MSESGWRVGSICIKQGPYVGKKRELDYDDDQEQIVCFNTSLNIDRAIRKFQGIANAVISDGILDDTELKMLRLQTRMAPLL